MLYMGAAKDKHEEGEDEPEGVICSRCGEMTLYSSADLLPCEEFKKLCLSAKCIEAAVLELASNLDSADAAQPPRWQTSAVCSLKYILLTLILIILLLKLIVIVRFLSYLKFVVVHAISLRHWSFPANSREYWLYLRLIEV